MATYVLDTNAFSALMARHPRMVARVTSASESHRVVTCPIVRGEIRYGLERMPSGRRRLHLEQTAANLFPQFPCEQVSEAAGDVYARIKRDAERMGAPLDENDLWIAATTMTLGAVLVTADSHFQRIRGLTTEDWTQ